MRIGGGPRRRDERAASAIEFSIVAPIFLVLVFLIISAGLWFYARNVALTSARQGVSYLRLAGTNADPDSYLRPSEQVAELYANEVGGGFIDDADAEAEISERTGRVSMTVTGTVTLPILADLEIEQTAYAEIEAFRPDTEDDQ